MIDHKDIELAQVKVIKTALWKGRKYDNLVKNYGNYLKKLRTKKDLNNYIKILAVKIFLKEEAYTEKLKNYRKRYKDNDLYSSLEELYEFYYHIALRKIRWWNRADAQSNGNLVAFFRLKNNVGENLAIEIKNIS